MFHLAEYEACGYKSTMHEFCGMFCQSETNNLQNCRYGVSQEVGNRAYASAASESKGIIPTQIKNSLTVIGRRLASGFLCKVKLYRFSKISSEIRKDGISGCSKKTFE